MDMQRSDNIINIRIRIKAVGLYQLISYDTNNKQAFRIAARTSEKMLSLVREYSLNKNGSDFISSLNF